MNGPDGDRSRADSALAALLRDIARDVAHELRSPVQSVVVNLEVLRRRAAKGEFQAVENRAAIVEEEVRRLHLLADAFVGLSREPTAGPSTMPAETMLAVADPIVDVIARSRHVKVERSDPPPGTLVRVLAEPAALAIIRLALALCEAAKGRATLAISGETSPAGFTVRLQLEAADADDRAEIADSALDGATRALSAAAAWLDGVGGTAAVEAGSDKVLARALVTVPRAT